MRIGVISDPHCGAGGRMDDSDQQAFARAVIWLVRVAKIEQLVITGDLVETWQFSLSAIMRHWAETFRYLDELCASEGVSVAVTQGNHDGDPEKLETALRHAMPRTLPIVAHHLVLGGVVYLHGHDPWDAVNSAGPRQWLGRLLTIIAGGLEMIGLNEQWLNPVHWDRMARRARGEKDRLHLAVLHDIPRWAREHGIEAPIRGVVVGHTHLQEMTRDNDTGIWLMNAGTLTKGHCEAALVVDGNANTINLATKEKAA